MRLSTTLPLAAMAAVFSIPAYAASITGDASAGVVAPLQLFQTEDMFFGIFAPGSSAGTVSTAGAVTNGIKLLGGDAPRPGKFRVMGEPELAYTITGSPNVTLTRDGGPETMSAALTYPTGQSLDGDGDVMFSVSGLLTVSSTQAPGSYAGTYNVNVNY